MAWIALNYIPRVVLQSESGRLAAKARWLHWGCRRVIRVFGIEINASGSAPSRGLLVSNHLSYVDILVLSTLTPCVFVAKREVKRWPIFGWFATLSGTVFVDRGRRLATGVSIDAIEGVLQSGALVVLFPEGTSSNGRQVLPFKSALMEPVVRGCGHSVSVGAIHYELTTGNVEEEVCYWKDMILVPHLLNLLSKPGLTGWIRFSATERTDANRKVLGHHLHMRVSELNRSINTTIHQFINDEKLPKRRRLTASTIARPDSFQLMPAGKTRVYCQPERDQRPCD